MKVNDKVFVVTGGGSGMGRELCLHLLEKGASVAMADINEAGMKETAELAGDAAKRLSIHVLNIADRAKVNELPDAVLKAHGQVDGIINNAGIIQPFVKVNELDFDRIERIMNVNFYGTLYMIKAFLPHLLQRSEAHVANVSSMGGFLPVPGQSLYGASKAAVKLLTEALHSELQETNVGVTVIFPGAVNTNITKNSDVTTPSAGDKGGKAMKILQPSEAARIMIEAIERDKSRVFVGKDSKFMDFMYRLNPDRAARLIYKNMKDLI